MNMIVGFSKNTTGKSFVVMQCRSMGNRALVTQLCRSAQITKR